MSQLTLNNQDISQSEISQFQFKISKISQPQSEISQFQFKASTQIEIQAQEIAPEIRVDSDPDADFGTFYRLWHGTNLLGTFYHALDNKWVAQPCNSDDRPRCNTAIEAQLAIVISENAGLKRRLELAYTSDNFGCYNRVGGHVKGNEFLQKERRRIASGQLTMVCCDIAGMGKRNTEIGEVAVNQAIRQCLTLIRSWRGIFFISQLNSGDEFVFIVDRVDAIDIIPRMDSLFKSAGFDGIYGVVNPIGDDYISSANDGMSLVYQMKSFAKSL